MITGQAIFSLLSGSTAVNTACGGTTAVGDTPGTAGRIAPNFIPKSQNDFPSIYFYSDEIDQQVTMEGPRMSAIDNAVKIVVQAVAYADMVSLSQQVIAAMNVTRRIVAGIGIQGIFFKSSSELEVNLPDLGDNFTVNQNEMEFQIIFDLLGS